MRDLVFGLAQGVAKRRRESKKAILLSRAVAAKELAAASAPKSWKPAKKSALLDVGGLSDFLPPFPAPGATPSTTDAMLDALGDAGAPSAAPAPAPAAPKQSSGKHLPRSHGARRRGFATELQRMTAVLALPVFGANPIATVSAHLNNTVGKT